MHRYMALYIYICISLLMYTEREREREREREIERQIDWFTIALRLFWASVPGSGSEGPEAKMKPTDVRQSTKKDVHQSPDVPKGKPQIVASRGMEGSRTSFE